MLVAVTDVAGHRRDRGESSVGGRHASRDPRRSCCAGRIVEAVLAIDLNTLKVLLEDEVDDASDRIRSVGGRGAAGHHVDPLDQRHRNLIDVGRDVLIRGAGSPAPNRRPFTSTRVRCGPRPRRSTVENPPWRSRDSRLLPKSALEPMMFCGRELIRSVMSVCPSSWISWLVTMVVGLVAEMFAGTGIRDPVTTTSCRTGSGSAVARCLLRGGGHRRGEARPHRQGHRESFHNRSDATCFGDLIPAPLEVGY